VNCDSETVYSDGIEFEVSDTDKGINVSGEYEGEIINASYTEGDIIEVNILEEDVEEKYSLVFDNFNDIVDNIADDVDIDAIISSNPRVDIIESANVEDVLQEQSVEIFDEDNDYVDTIEFGGYEGQVAITVAGSASYYILSALVSVIFTREVYKVIKASTASKNKVKRGNGKVIPKNKVPGKAKKNKKVKGRIGSLSTKGDPSSSTDLYSSDGKKLLQRRFYDAKGKVYLDVDFSHGGSHKFPHAHYWVWY
jgi:hypothetical protein